MEDLISVVIPVYNVEDYLSECLESIINQSYSNLEIILIDDGSTDTSSEICNYYKNRDERIIVIHKLNEGVSRARNIGLNNATGRYVCIIDSDDYVSSDYILEMYNEIGEVDLVCCGAYILEKKDKSFGSICQSLDDSIVDRLETLINLFSSSGFRGWGWNKMFKMDIIRCNNICFNEELKYCEDEVFCLDYIMHCKNSRFIRSILYHYRLNETSVNHMMYMKKQFDYNALDRLEADKICWRTISSINNNRLSDVFRSRRFRSNMITMDKFLRNYNGDRKTLMMLKKKMKEDIRYYLKCEVLSIKRKCGVLLVAFFPSLYFKLK